MKFFSIAVLIFLKATLVFGEECELKNNCRLVWIDGSPEWAEEEGHYLLIQECIDEAKSGDTCLIRPGRYHEQVTIRDKSNIAIRGDLDYTRPLIDGTVVLSPENGNAWDEDMIDGKKVCSGVIKLKHDQHPFQLFLNEGNDFEMMTNARWPNALWIDRHPETGVPQVFNNTFWGKADNGIELGKMVDRKDENGISPLAASGLDMTGAMAILNINSFQSYHRLITSHNEGENFFFYDDHDCDDHHGSPKVSQYYIDSKEELLDNPGEWFYNKETGMLKFMPPSGSCPDSSEDMVRGRVMDYAITIGTVDEVYIANLDFFASNMIASPETESEDDINGLYLDSLNFIYPVSSHRMLQDDSNPKATNIYLKNGETLSIDNCIFFGGEGTALHYDGKSVKITNNLFQWNDWSGVMENGNDGTVVVTNHDPIQEEFSGNTLWYNGASAGYRPSTGGAVVTENLFVGQRVGDIMNDGAEVQVQNGPARYLHFERNWMFDSTVLGVRTDGAEERVGKYATIKDNVDWKTGGYMVKGDYHNVTGNLNLPRQDEKDVGFKVIYILREYYDYVMNEHSIIENNAAWLAGGGNDLHCDGKVDATNRAYYPLAGLKSNNYYGNASYGCDQKDFDDVVVLDGNVVPDVSYKDLPDMLVDVDNFDFRPKPDSILGSADNQIGPYPSIYTNGDRYFIPGRRESIPSFPIPKHNSVAKMRDDLIFQPAYRCNDVDDKHLVYLAEKDKDFTDEPITELTGDGNVIVFEDIGFNVEPDTWYKWKVDCIKATSEEKKEGDIWLFKIDSE